MYKLGVGTGYMPEEQADKDPQARSQVNGIVWCQGLSSCQEARLGYWIQNLIEEKQNQKDPREDTATEKMIPRPSSNTSFILNFL